MGLKNQLLRGVYAYGFERPSEIQQQAIVPMCMNNRDLIVQTQSGTGKTSIYAIGLLQRIDLECNALQALVLCPTRELAYNVWKVVLDLGFYLEARVEVLVGGRKISDDLEKCAAQDQPQIIVGTPGRIFDMIRRGALKIENVEHLILDEVDELLTRGFEDIVWDIYCELPSKVSVAGFCVTDVIAVLKRFQTKPLKLRVQKPELTLQGMKQFYIDCDREEWKLDTLCDLYNDIAITQSIIFVNTRRKVDWLTQMLEDRDFRVSSTHGAQSQEEREKVLSDFRHGTTRILLTTDLLARGIDVAHVAMVINYDLPKNHENYLHRIGRSGRFGRQGLAISFCSVEDLPQLKELEEFYQTKIEEFPADFAALLV
jgi:translation initiation factor 4A